MNEEQILNLASIPEHSIPLMNAMSQGNMFYIDNYVFYNSSDWLMAIGYPLNGEYDEEIFENTISKALNIFKNKENVQCFVIAPSLPKSMQEYIIDRDQYYILGIDAEIPLKLRGPIQKASEKLKIEESDEFTAKHRRLWGEFLGLIEQDNKKVIAPHVKELYARTPEAIRLCNGKLRFLNAYDSEDNLVACLLLDYAPNDFVSYILGAHSKSHYVSHAVDLLFATMLKNAKNSGKKFIHLGLGVNEGILRFKRKWGAKEHIPYVMGVWDHKRKSDDTTLTFALALLRSSPNISARQMLDKFPEQRPFAMIWEIEKNGKKSWIAGTAHFFCYSFEQSFIKLFKNVDNVIFEGPLDEQFMKQVDEAGKNIDKSLPPLVEMLSEDEIVNLERIVRGPEGKILKLLNMEAKKKIDVRWYLKNTRPWYAFFTVWTAFLERLGWHGSVDMEAWRVANKLGKNIIAMENLEEQLASLDSVPRERVIHYFKECRTWSRLAKRNLKTYLAGDLEKMMGSSAEFPTRTGKIIGVRDQRFRERMRPYIEDGRSIVFVGSAHMINLREMLKEDGFSVKRCLPSLKHRVMAFLRNDKEVCVL